MAALKRKLVSLSYHSPDNFTVSNEEHVKCFIGWAENQKIRAYPVEQRSVLEGSEWRAASRTYFKQLQCPYDLDKAPLAAVDWLASYAVRLEYSDNADNFIAASKASQQPCNTHPGVSLDVNTVHFKSGVNTLRDILRISPHQDYLEVLKACRILVERNLAPGAVKVTGDKMVMGKAELGLDLSDSSLNEAAKALRLLHVEELRILQTQINEAIVTAQALTANPKTDTKLGTVGR